MIWLLPHTSYTSTHLVGLVEEAASTPLDQELDVLIDTAARKLSGQIVSVFTNTHTQTHKIKTTT